MQSAPINYADSLNSIEQQLENNESSALILCNELEKLVTDPNFVKQIDKNNNLKTQFSSLYAKAVQYLAEARTTRSRNLFLRVIEANEHGLVPKNSNNNNNNNNNNNQLISSLDNNNIRLTTPLISVNKPQNYKAFVDDFNLQSILIPSDILSKPTAQASLMAVQRWIEVMRICFVNKDYNSVVAIMAALNGVRVNAENWPLSNNTLLTFKFINAMMSTRKNSEWIRPKLESEIANRNPVIPPINLYTGMLTFALESPDIEESNKHMRNVSDMLTLAGETNENFIQFLKDNQKYINYRGVETDDQVSFINDQIAVISGANDFTKFTGDDLDTQFFEEAKKKVTEIKLAKPSIKSKLIKIDSNDESLMKLMLHAKDLDSTSKMDQKIKVYKGKNKTIDLSELISNIKFILSELNKLKSATEKVAFLEQIIDRVKMNGKSKVVNFGLDKKTYEMIRQIKNNFVKVVEMETNASEETKEIKKSPKLKNLFSRQASPAHQSAPTQTDSLRDFSGLTHKTRDKRATTELDLNSGNTSTFKQKASEKKQKQSKVAKHSVNNNGEREDFAKPRNPLFNPNNVDRRHTLEDSKTILKRDESNSSLTLSIFEFTSQSSSSNKSTPSSSLNSSRRYSIANRSLNSSNHNYKKSNPGNTLDMHSNPSGEMESEQPDLARSSSDAKIVGRRRGFSVSQVRHYQPGHFPQRAKTSTQQEQPPKLMRTQSSPERKRIVPSKHERPQLQSSPRISTNLGKFMKNASAHDVNNNNNNNNNVVDSKDNEPTKKGNR